MAPRLSWLLPVKNGMPFLPETLASIGAQTYRDWEVLAWDNGSTDGTLEILKEWIPGRLPGVVFEGNPLTLGKSLAALVDLSKTEFCARIDADDVNRPERLARQVRFLDEHPDVSIVGTQIHLVDERGQSLQRPHSVPLSHTDIVCALLSRTPLAHPTAVFRREAVAEVGGYRDLEEWNGANIEDYDLWMRSAAAGKRMANLPEILLEYRVHQNSSTEVSIRLNRLTRAGNLCFQRHAPQVFGCTEEVAAGLRERRHGLSLYHALRIERWLRTKYGMLPWRSGDFFDSFLRLTASRDVISRLVFAMSHPAGTVLWPELRSIAKDSLVKVQGLLPFGRSKRG